MKIVFGQGAEPVFKKRGLACEALRANNFRKRGEFFKMKAEFFKKQEVVSKSRPLQTAFQ